MSPAHRQSALLSLPMSPGLEMFLARLQTLLGRARDVALAHAPAVTAVVAVLLVAAGALVWSRRAARRRWYAEARTVTVLAPAGIDVETAMHGARRA